MSLKVVVFIAAYFDDSFQWMLVLQSAIPLLCVSAEFWSRVAYACV
jgi:hypothetical protein